MKVNICTSDIFRLDAVGNFTLQLKRFLENNGIEVQLFARHFNIQSTPDIIHFDLLRTIIESDDLILAEYSIFESGNELYRQFKNPKILYYHGITPPEYFYGYDPQTEKHCRDGILQAPLFDCFDFFLANSKFMIAELKERVFPKRKYLPSEFDAISAVMPPVINIKSRFSESIINNEFKKPFDFDKYWLYVGRIAPHKKIEDLLEWFNYYLELDSNMVLVIVGCDTPPSYGDAIRKIVNQSEELKHRVIFCGAVPDNVLYQIYKGAFGFITLSQHEGFCIPIVEAIGLGIPVFARAKAAIPETIGREDLLLDGQSMEAYAQEVFDVLNDNVRLNDLISRQNIVYYDLVASSSGKLLLSAIESVLATHKITC